MTSSLRSLRYLYTTSEELHQAGGGKVPRTGPFLVFKDFSGSPMCFLGFPGNSAGKESACNAGDPGSIPGQERSPGGGKGYLLQYFGLENSKDCIVYRVTKSRTGLSNFHFHFQGTMIPLTVWQKKKKLKE